VHIRVSLRRSGVSRLASDESGPWTPWLRKLLAQACTECHAKGAPVIGVCLTGSFALSRACDPQVLAPVLGEPSLPFWPADALHVAPKELAESDEPTTRGCRFAPTAMRQKPFVRPSVSLSLRRRTRFRIPGNYDSGKAESSQRFHPRSLRRKRPATARQDSRSNCLS
jgi:hypothetical protein